MTQYVLHNTIGKTLVAHYGLICSSGMLFADDGFGNFLQVRLDGRLTASIAL